MNLRKAINLPTKRQRDLLEMDNDVILAACNIIAKNERNDLEESCRLHDEICPNCKSKKADCVNNIVNKIALVKGSGNISGNAFHVSGSVLINTHVINHCNICGNGWEKFKMKEISETNILRVCLNYLAQLSQNPSYHKEFDWKLEAVKVFEDSYAETIFRLAEKQKKYLILELNSELSLSKLRNTYKSVYDE